MVTITTVMIVIKINNFYEMNLVINNKATWFIWS